MTQPPQRGDVLSVVEAAKLVGVHFTTLYRQIEAGKVAFFKFGGIVFVPYTEVERLNSERERKRKEV